MVSKVTRVCVTGGDGIMGRALRAYFPHADYLSRASCDVTNGNMVKQWFSRHSYDLIIHGAAATKHDSPADVLIQTNVVGTAQIVSWARRTGARLVYLSTDYAYSGSSGPHHEGDGLRPVGDYGRSKVAGELVAGLYPNTVIIRGSWYSEMRYTRAATDAFTSKIPVAKAAAQVAQVAVSSLTGPVNIGGPRRSLFEITLEYNQRCQPCSRHDVHLPYPLPADTSLDLSRLNSLQSRR